MAENKNPKLYQSERAYLYFRRANRRGTIPIYIAAAVICALFAYMNLKAGHSGIYFLVAVFFLGMAVWQFFYTKKADVKAEEVDARFEYIRRTTGLIKFAATDSEMYLEEYEALDKYILYGYTNESIRDTEAHLRADAGDNIARSTHMQMSCMALDKYSLISFSIVRSLIEQKESQDNTFWPYTQISGVSLEKTTHMCPTEPGGEKAEKRSLYYVKITSKELGLSQRFAISDDCRTQAEEFVQILKTKANLKQTGEKS